MTDKLVLRAALLGNFELRYGPEIVQLKKRQSSKPVRLLQLLLFHRKTGISRQGVIEALYGTEAEINTANNLNATVFQLRRLLQNTTLPVESYICTDGDRYSFQCSFPIEVDTEEVLALRQEALEKEGQERMELLDRICSLYRGRFLPELDGDIWAEAARSYYQGIYQESMEALCQMLWDAQEYQKILHLMNYAVKLFPFDEWQTWQYESLLALGHVQEAQKVYREAEKLYLSGLDAPLPERMRRKAHTPKGENIRETRNVRLIREQLNKAGRDGPYCLPFPSFLDAYHLICHMSKTAGQPICLILYTLQGKGLRLDRNFLCASMEQLEAALYQTLRQEDAFTRYSRSQFLSVLIGVEESDCGAISRRVSEQFHSIASEQRFTLDCQAVSSDRIQASRTGQS